SPHHSQTFPCKSKSPSSFDSRVPTSWTWPPEFSLYHAYGCSSLSSTQHHSPAEPAPQANSHSASVGSEQPTQMAKSIASTQLTSTTGSERSADGSSCCRGPKRP